MASPFEAILRGPARRFLRDEATAEEKQELGRIIDRVLCFDPYVDNITKFTFALPPIILVLYDDGRFRLCYHLIHNVEIQILNIGRASDPMGGLV